MQVEIIKAIQSISSPVLDAVFEGITFLGEQEVAILVGAALLLCINKRKGFEFAYLLVTGLLVNVTLKEIFDMPRPIGVEGVRSLRVETATGKSFPSGHTQTATMLYWWLQSQVRKPLVTGLSLVVILGVALSRLYLGVHWPIDVLAAIGIGMGWVWLMAKVYSKMEGDRSILAGLAIAWAGAFFFFSEDYMKLLGLLTGLTASILADRKWIHFEAGGSWLQKAARLLFGASGALAILVLGKMVFIHPIFGHVLRYGLVMVWIGMIVPMLCKRFISIAKDGIKEQ